MTQSKLQQDLKNLESWENIWLMDFHPAKCFVLRFTKKHSKTIFDYKLHGQVLESVENTKYLGLNISETLDWQKHIDSVTAKGNKRLGFLRRNLKISNQNTKAMAYKSLVRPVMEYGSSIWDPHKKCQVQQLEMVQRRAAGWVCNS